ncbi:MAG: hypothetical protein A2Z93_13840 [Curvibacter sp. GWA2_64_110]|nr:MAG: hypothetical protein A2Z93_13840 [Curvibacter sp. GWA2_64_110]HCY17287.1 hypothetical protein [Curvibacter sp.]
METPDIAQQLQSHIGRQVRALRLARNQSQAELARQAGVALGAIKSLEAGSGATLRSLTCVVQALGRSEWLESLQASAAPATRTPERLRAGKPRTPAAPARHP